MSSRGRFVFMNPISARPRPKAVTAFVLFSAAAFGTARIWMAQAADGSTKALEAPFERQVKPFLKQNCERCHNADNPVAGVRVDNLDASLDDKHVTVWQHIRGRVRNESMPPKGQPQPSASARQDTIAWIDQALQIARMRPAPKNGSVRRLTVAQYRNTLKELLQLDDDLTEILPPEAVSKDGFLNNKETLQLSPLLLEAYLEIAEEALGRAIVDPQAKPAIQKFRVDFGASINPKPFPEELILGANSLLLDNKDFLVTEPRPGKPFAFDQNFMRTKYRFIEGYVGNATVRGWRDYDSIYHSVFACMRGSRGYPKGHAFDAVPEGLALRPAIPNEEQFDSDGTYGPKANFKISLRELPDHGRFRVTVTAARYDDGMMLASSDAAQPANTDAIVWNDPKGADTLTVKTPGIYQIDVHAGTRAAAPVVETSRLNDGLSGNWPLDGAIAGGQLQGDAHFVDSPFGKAVMLDGMGDSVTVPRNESMNVGTGDFTVAAWIHPRQLRRAGIISVGGTGWTHGWYLEMPDNKGILRLDTAGPDNQGNGSATSPQGMLRANAWQHVAAVVRRSSSDVRLFINGYQVARGEMGPANLDNPKMDLKIGALAGAQNFRGEIDEVRLYRRALAEAEVQGLVEPGRRFAQVPPGKPREVTLSLGGREFATTLQHPSFAAVRLPAGPLAVNVRQTGVTNLDRVVFTPLDPNHSIARRFAAMEKRSPRLGVHLGLRRDCGSTVAPVGPPRRVSSVKPSQFVFEGAIRNFPSPDVEKDNVNYLAGIREIAVRSEFTDGRDMPRLLIQSVDFEGPFYDSWPPQSHRNIFIDSPRQNDRRAYAREIVRSFAARAYRRPVTAAEEASPMAVFDKSAAAGRDFRDSVKDALQAVLTSPQFLFLIEKSATPGPEPLDESELASKLSYFLWNGPPDRATLTLASAGTLRQKLDSEVSRLIADERFSRFIDEFGAQWLSLDKFSVLEPDRTRYPKLTRDARVHLRREPVEFLRHLIRNNLPAKNLIDSDFLVVNEAVANYYDLGAKTESGFQFVPVTHGRRELGGVLTQAAILAGLSDGRESNPVKRGAWLARKIVSEPPADPPPNVPALPEDATQLTLRQRIEKHRTQPGCVQCHLKIDPWGVAFEEFDAGGRLKLHGADARSKLPDNFEVSGAIDLKRYLGEDRIDQVAFSVLKHLTVYATGRNLSYSESDFLKRDGLKLKADGYRMKDMVRYVVNSRPFLEK